MIKRQQIWLNTDAAIQKHNSRQSAGLETFKMVHNEFSDMTTAEQQAYLGATRPYETHGHGRGDIMLDMKQAATTTTRKPITTVKPATTASKPSTTRKPTTTAKPITTTKRPTTTTRKPTTTTARINNTVMSIDWRDVPGTL